MNTHGRHQVQRGAPFEVASLAPQTARALFEVVVHAAWADGRLEADEVTAARAVAGWLEPSAGSATGRLLLGPELSLEAIVSVLGWRDAEVALALALWMTLADGIERPRETALLDRIRLLTGIRRDAASDLRRLVRRARAMHPSPAFGEQLSWLVHALRPRLLNAC